MSEFFSSGLVQFAGIIITALSAYGVARFNRSGSREANQTTAWTNLVGALQKEVANLREEQTRVDSLSRERFRILDEGNRNLTDRVNRLERSRYKWKYWGQRIVPLMEEQGVRFPPPPEALEDTDPNLRST